MNLVKEVQSIKYRHSLLKEVRVSRFPTTTPFIIDNPYDKEFIKSLINSKLNKVESVYIILFNTSDKVMVSEITKDNIEDFFFNLFHTYLAMTNYRYCYIPDLFPITDIHIEYGGHIETILSWSVELIDELYDVPEYIDRFESIIKSEKSYTAKDKLNALIGDKQGVLYELASKSEPSVELSDFSNEYLFEDYGGYDEYLYSVNASLIRRKAYHATYVLNRRDKRLELWISIPKDMIATE